MPSYKELIEQRVHLEREIAQARAQEVNEAILKIRELINLFGLTDKDIFSSKKNKKLKIIYSDSEHSSAIKIKPKYHNLETGDTWTGRGKEPKWIQGKERNTFLIECN